MSNNRNKDIKPGFDGINFTDSSHLKRMPEWKPKHNKKKNVLSDQKKLDETPSLQCKLNIDAIETVDDIKLILEQMDLNITFNDEESYNKLKHLLKIHK